MLTYTQFYVYLQSHDSPITLIFTTPVSGSPVHRFSGKYRLVHKVKFQFLAFLSASNYFEPLEYVEVVEICSFLYCFRMALFGT